MVTSMWQPVKIKLTSNSLHYQLVWYHTEILLKLSLVNIKYKDIKEELRVAHLWNYECHKMNCHQLHLLSKLCSLGNRQKAAMQNTTLFVWVIFSSVCKHSNIATRQKGINYYYIRIGLVKQKKKDINNIDDDTGLLRQHQ